MIAEQELDLISWAREIRWQAKFDRIIANKTESELYSCPLIAWVSGVDDKYKEITFMDYQKMELCHEAITIFREMLKYQLTETTVNTYLSVRASFWKSFFEILKRNRISPKTR